MKSRDLIANSMREWRTVNAADLASTLVDRLDAEEVFRLAHRALADEIRAELRAKDANGVPKYGSIEIRTDSGRVERVYKQTALFDVDEVRAAAAYHVNEARAHIATAVAYARVASKKFGVQLEIPQLESGAA